MHSAISIRSGGFRHFGLRCRVLMRSRRVGAATAAAFRALTLRSRTGLTLPVPADGARRHTDQGQQRKEELLAHATALFAVAGVCQHAGHRHLQRRRRLEGAVLLVLRQQRGAVRGAGPVDASAARAGQGRGRGPVGRRPHPPAPSGGVLGPLHRRATRSSSASFAWSAESRPSRPCCAKPPTPTSPEWPPSSIKPRAPGSSPPPSLRCSWRTASWAPSPRSRRPTGRGRWPPTSTTWPRP